jgi:hypothetical protein
MIDISDTAISRHSCIRIQSIEPKENKLFIKYLFSEDVKKYFKTDELTLEYDGNIEAIDKSILSIPALSVIITVAWAAGANVYLESVDESYLASLERLKLTYKKWFSNFSFDSDIIFVNKVSNKFYNTGSALLFSGGLDSITSYIVHKDENPTLISIWGADIPLSSDKFWHTVKTQLLDFATEYNNSKIGFIKTNARDILNDERLAKSFGDIVGGWWETVSHGIILTGVTAPALINKAGTLYIASTHSSGYNRPHGSHGFLRVDVRFCDIKIIYDLPEYNRHEKVKYILKNNLEYSRYLRVCFSQFNQYNCGTCEKCLRTILSLVLEDIDPNSCNFNINDKTFTLIKNFLKNDLVIKEDNERDTWKAIQDHIPDNLDHKMYHSTRFFKWFKKYDLSGCTYRTNTRPYRILKLCCLLRYWGVYGSITKIFNFILKKMRGGVNI